MQVKTEIETFPRWTVYSLLQHIETIATHPIAKCVRVLRSLIQADARALWAYRVLRRAAERGTIGMWVGYSTEALILERADALVAEDPSLGEGL
jgi:hypothetical protein